MKETQKLTEVTLEFSELGFRRIIVPSGNDEEFAAAHTLLARVPPELRALDEALRKPAGIDVRQQDKQ